MLHIAIISSSVREGRLSHRVSLFLKNFLEENNLASAEILDLKAYNFPLFNERLAHQPQPSEEVIKFTERFKAADGILIVAPVYNGSFPAALKNVIDLYFKEWHHKPAAIASATSGKVPGIATIQQLQTLLLKLGAIVTPSPCTFINTGEEFSETGEALKKEQAGSLARPMIEEFLWLINKTGEKQ